MAVSNPEPQPPKSSGTWTRTLQLLGLSRYREMRQEGEKKARQKIETMNLMKQNLEETIMSAKDLETEINKNKETLTSIVTEFEEKYIKKQKKDLETEVNKNKKTLTSIVTEFEEKYIKKQKKDLETKISQITRLQINNIRAFKNMESELRKLQAFIIVIPLILVAFGVFFKDRIDDIMKIDVLEAEIENLKLRASKNGTQPGQPPYQGQGVCPPGDETCCSPEGFFTC